MEAVVVGGDVEGFFEDEDEIIVGHEAAVVGDLFDGMAGVAQEADGAIEAEALEVLLGAEVEFAPEELAHLGAGELDVPGEIFDGEAGEEAVGFHAVDDGGDAGIGLGREDAAEQLFVLKAVDEKLAEEDFSGVAGEVGIDESEAGEVGELAVPAGGLEEGGVMLREAVEEGAAPAVADVGVEGDLLKARMAGQEGEGVVQGVGEGEVTTGGDGGVVTVDGEADGAAKREEEEAVGALAGGEMPRGSVAPVNAGEDFDVEIGEKFAEIPTEGGAEAGLILDNGLGHELRFLYPVRVSSCGAVFWVGLRFPRCGENEHRFFQRRFILCYHKLRILNGRNLKSWVI